MGILQNKMRDLFFFFYKKKLKKQFLLKLGKNVHLNRKCEFGGRNYLSDYASLISSAIGYASYLGRNTHIKNTKIGKYTSIGPDVKCVFGKHPSDTFVSTHPAFFSTLKQSGFSYVKEQLFQEFEKPLDQDEKYSIIIGNDVWIGAGVTLMDGVTIGDGAILATNSLVVKDIEPYAIVGGVPAKVIKYRFEKDEIEFLRQLRWWDKTYDWIEENIEEFKDVKKLMQKVKSS